MVNLISDLGLSLDADSASNLLAGIFDATENLSNTKVSAESYMAVATCLRVGGRKPSVTMGAQQVQTQGPMPDLSALIPVSPASLASRSEGVVSPAQRGEPKEPTQTIAGFANPPVVSLGDDHISAVSPEERPFEEGVISETPEPDWLTPKIFKGSSLG